MAEETGRLANEETDREKHRVLVEVKEGVLEGEENNSIKVCQATQEHKH